jgi:hypothetical protein
MRCLQFMRTTLDIDDDILAAAKELASGQKTTAGGDLRSRSQGAYAADGP